MAENESLDLSSPNARRWDAVRDAALKGAPMTKVEAIGTTRLYAAMRKVVRQFKRCGVTVADFTDRRNSPRSLQELLRRTGSHDYAKLLLTVLKSYSTANRAECLKRWGHAVLDTVFGQLSVALVGTEHFPNAFDTRVWCQEVQSGLDCEIARIATKLSENPEWEPRRAPSKTGLIEDPTTDLLTMSLLGGATK